MSLDISPDGRTIIFDLLGDLYTIPITGGRATPVTHGLAFNRQPRYSPDGRLVVYVSDRGGSDNVWITDRDGRNPRQLSHLEGDIAGAATSPAWSPDGRTIVVSQRLHAISRDVLSLSQATRWMLAAYDVRTGRMRWISDTAANRARAVLGATFGPDACAVYAAVGSALPQFEDFDTWHVARLDLATGQVEPQMWAGVGRLGMRPALSPDGQYLAYVSSAGSHPGLRLRHLRTGRERWLTRKVLDDPPIAQATLSRDLAPGYAFTPDSKAVIAAYGGAIHRIELAGGHSAQIPFVANVERELGPLSVHRFSLPDTAIRTRSVMQPALSPDGTRVAFTALDRIWLMELPIGGKPPAPPYPLTADSGIGEFYPSWSPDGRWIAYSAWVDGEGGALRRVGVVHDQLERPPPSERLTLDTASYFHTAVAPDGRRVVAVRAPLSPERLLTPSVRTDDKGWPTAALDPDLVWVPADGGRPRSITSLTDEQHGYFAEPRYPVDQVYFTADTGRIYVGMVSWRWNGTDRQVAVNTAGRPRTAIAGERADLIGVLSPDGGRALVTSASTLFEITLPQPGSAPPGATNTLSLEPAQRAAFEAPLGAARRWGLTLEPWITWSRDGHVALFSQGGTLLVGKVREGRWTSFGVVDVPLEIPVDVPRGTLVLRGARLITMRGHEVIDRGDLVVRDNRIVALGPAGGVAIPARAHVIDVSGTTILPGYVDLHDHMLLSKGLHPGECWQCLTKLAYGITAARDPNSVGNDVFAYRERERSGTLLGPRVLSTGTAYYGSDRPIRSPSDAADIVRPYADYFGSETFKVYPIAVGRRERQLLAMAARERGLNATIHAELELAITATIDGFSGVEHSHTIQLHDDVAEFFGRSGTTYTQTYGADISGAWQYLFRRYGQMWDDPKMRRFMPPSAREGLLLFPSGPPEWATLRRIVSGSASIATEGGRVGVGSHGNIPGLGLHYEMWLYALGGMPTDEILRSATLVGAVALGHGEDFGTLDVGKLADLQVLDHNPLVDIHNSTSIRYVMKNGRLYRATDLSEVWPRRRPLRCIYLWETPCSQDSLVRPRTFGRGGTERALGSAVGTGNAKGQGGPAPRLQTE